MSSCNHKVCATQRFIRLASEAVTDKSEQITIIKNFETHRNILLKSICISYVQMDCNKSVIILQ